MPKTILVADDDSMITRLFSLHFEQAGTEITVRSASNGDEAVAFLSGGCPDMVVLDIRMPKGDGFTVLEHLKKQQCNVPVVVLTNYRNDAYLEKCQAYGVKEYLVKHELNIDRIMDKVGAYLS
jgi:CheY-like chemotaxis protein